MTALTTARSRALRIAVVALVALLAGAGIWQLQTVQTEYKMFSVEDVRTMGTRADLFAVVESNQEPLAQHAIEDAVAELSQIDALMSNHLAESEIGVLNAAPAEKWVPLSPRTLHVLRLARDYARDTQGAFDVTCRPLLDLYRAAQKENLPPTREQLSAALASVGWDKFEISDRGARKKIASAAIDLGGIAKKYGIDQAVAAMQADSCAGGMVNVGGDLRVFGRHPNGRKWRIDIKNPFGEGEPLGQIQIQQGAVCTSGNYERFYTIGKRRYSHIVDPRTGQAADNIPSVTVIGDDAMAGVWATALSVLGADGLRLLPRGVEAMVVTGDRHSYQVNYSGGFAQYLSADAAQTQPASQPATQPEPELPTTETPDDYSTATPAE